MMLWQFTACIDGWNRAQGGDDRPPPMSDDKFDNALREWEERDG